MSHASSGVIPVERIIGCHGDGLFLWLSEVYRWPVSHIDNGDF